jgi:hypothetical protein
VSAPALAAAVVRDLSIHITPCLEFPRTALTGALHAVLSARGCAAIVIAGHASVCGCACVDTTQQATGGAPVPCQVPEGLHCTACGSSIGAAYAAGMNLVYGRWQKTSEDSSRQHCHCRYTTALQYYHTSWWLPSLAGRQPSKHVSKLGAIQQAFSWCRLCAGVLLGWVSLCVLYAFKPSLFCLDCAGLVPQGPSKLAYSTYAT